MRTSNVFKLHLTQSELRQLASHIGYLEIPLLEEPGTAASDRQPMPVNDHVSAGLQKKHILARRQDGGWNVNSVVLVLLQIVADPDEVISIHIRDVKRGVQGFYAYLHTTFPLLVTLENDNLEFAIYSTIDGLKTRVLALLNLPDRLEHNLEPFNVRYTEQLARLLWDFPDNGIDSLNNLRLSETDASNLTSLFRKTKYAGLVSELKRLDSELGVASRYYLFWGKDLICEGKFVLGDLAEFIPLSKSEVNNRLDEIFRQFQEKK